MNAPPVAPRFASVEQQQPRAHSPDVLSSRSGRSKAPTLPYDSFNKDLYRPPSTHYQPTIVSTSYAPPELRDPSPRPQTPRSEKHWNTSLLNVYWSISSILGFKEKYSLVLGFIFGGALVGFCLARAFMMNPANVEHKTVPGEWFWYRQRLYKPNIFLHIYLTCIAGFFAVFQFIPAIRRRKMFLHRLNGYMTLLLLIPGTIAGGIVGRRAFGGAPNTQAAYYTLAVMIVFSALNGLRLVKQTRKHRTVSYTSSVITARIVVLIARRILSDEGNYYELWTCEELLFLQTTGKRDPNFTQDFPMCLASNITPSAIHVAVRASLSALPVNEGSMVRLTFGMGLWIGLLIHVVGVEIYIRATESSNMHRQGFILQRQCPEIEKTDL
ncbi:hypothetical protein FRB99_003519 [Tulasnella sp. 403]|nr:hypothetical protein FRB99_003519 [Tulasnella sp. 403]